MSGGDSYGRAAACLFRCFSDQSCFHFFVLYQPVIRRLSGGLVRHPRHHQTAERRRCAGPPQCDVIDDTIKLLNDDAALELFVCIFVALVAVVSCVCKTHTGCISLFFDTLHEFEAITTLSPIPGQAALWGESGCSTRKALPGKRRAEVFFAIHDTTQAAGRRRSGLLGDDAAWLSLLQVWCVGTRSRRFSFLVFAVFVGGSLTHDTFGLFFPCVFCSSRWDGGCCYAWWCCASGLLRQGSPAKVTCGRACLFQDTRRITHCSATQRVFLVLVRDDLTTQVALRSSMVFDDAVFVRFCSLCFFGFESDSSTVSLSFLYSHMTMSSFWRFVQLRSSSGNEP